MRHVFETMGTVASIELPDAAAVHIAELEAVFAEFDARFSLYEPRSELSRVADGSLHLLDASPVLRDSYLRATQWRRATRGLFSPNRPDGVIDLNGIVKAEAIESAGQLLDGLECGAWTINVGGDILVSADRAWSTGIADPADSTAVLATLELGGDRPAMATSGSAQRGDHIWSLNDTAPTTFVQVTVVAGDIVTADVLATAIVAGGRTALDDISDAWPIDVLTVDHDGALLATPGMAQKAAYSALG
ncbi:FAD:protein FMN transferase [soil metagenome]